MFIVKEELLLKAQIDLCKINFENKKKYIIKKNK